MLNCVTLQNIWHTLNNGSIALKPHRVETLLIITQQPWHNVAAVATVSPPSPVEPETVRLSLLRFYVLQTIAVLVCSVVVICSKAYQVFIMMMIGRVSVCRQRSHSSGIYAGPRFCSGSGAGVNTAIRCSLKGWSDHVMWCSLARALAKCSCHRVRSVQSSGGGQITITIKTVVNAIASGSMGWTCAAAQRSAAPMHKSYLITVSMTRTETWSGAV